MGAFALDRFFQPSKVRVVSSALMLEIDRVIS